MNFHSVAIEDTLGNVRFLAKFDLTGRTSYKTCFNCFINDYLIRVGTDVWARALGISGVNLCPGIRSWEVNFAQALCNF